MKAVSAGCHAALLQLLPHRAPLMFPLLDLPAEAGAHPARFHAAVVRAHSRLAHTRVHIHHATADRPGGRHRLKTFKPDVTLRAACLDTVQQG
jgi:hypothetical protein